MEDAVVAGCGGEASSRPGSMPIRLPRALTPASSPSARPASAAHRSAPDVGVFHRVKPAAASPPTIAPTMNVPVCRCFATFLLLAIGLLQPAGERDALASLPRG